STGSVIRPPLAGFGSRSESPRGDRSAWPRGRVRIARTSRCGVRRGVGGWVGARPGAAVETFQAGVEAAQVFGECRDVLGRPVGQRATEGADIAFADLFEPGLAL